MLLSVAEVSDGLKVVGFKVNTPWYIKLTRYTGPPHSDVDWARARRLFLTVGQVSIVLEYRCEARVGNGRDAHFGKLLLLEKCSDHDGCSHTKEAGDGRLKIRLWAFMSMNMQYALARILMTVC